RLKIANAPALQSFEYLGRGLEQVQWQCAQPLCFRVLGNDGDAGKSARRMDGSIGISGDGDIHSQPQGGSAGSERARNVCRRTKKAIESGDVENDCAASIPSAVRNPYPDQ